MHVNSGAEISLIYDPSEDEAAHQTNGHSNRTTTRVMQQRSNCDWTARPTEVQLDLLCMRAWGVALLRIKTKEMRRTEKIRAEKGGKETTTTTGKTLTTQ